MHKAFSQSKILIFVLSLSLGNLIFADDATERSDWRIFFDQSEATGAIVLSDERAESKADWIFNGKRAKKRFSPASTYKIPHALFALEAGVIRDEFETIPWDGVVRSYPAWNQNQSIRSSMRHSVVWVYQKFAREIGEQKKRVYLEKTDYGNQDPTGQDPYWVEGNLRISAYEQIALSLVRQPKNRLFLPSLPHGAFVSV